MTMITNLTPKQLRQAASIKERIVALQKKLVKLAGSDAPAPAKSGRKKRRKMSAAGRAKIAAAARARWAKVRAAKKK
jgi:hypothetical protein